MSEESPYVVDRATGGNVELENLLRSLLKCYYFESRESDKIMRNNIYIWDSCISAFQLYSSL